MSFNHTFKPYGTFTHSNGGGRWVQAGDLVIWQWRPPDPPALDSANIHPGHAMTQEDTMTGIMGWLIEGGNQGTFRARRLLVWDGSPCSFGAVPQTTATRRLAQRPTRCMVTAVTGSLKVLVDPAPNGIMIISVTCGLALSESDRGDPDDDAREDNADDGDPESLTQA